MKKYLLTALVLLGLATIVKAAGMTYTTPRGNDQALATADYGGVFSATSAFTVGHTTVCAPCKGVFYGVGFSTGNLGAFDSYDVWDATNTQMTGGQSPIWKSFNVYGSTGSVSGNASMAGLGFSGPPKPIRFKNGLIGRANSTPAGSYNLINILYWAEEN